MHFTHILADLLASGRTVRFTAPGHSMHPVIRHGDVLLVDPLDRPARVGDILLYAVADRPIAHRLVGFAEGGEGPVLVLKGDATTSADLPVRPGQVLGRVFAVDRHGRRFDPYGVRCVTVRVLCAAAARVKAELLKRWGRICPAARRAPS